MDLLNTFMSAINKNNFNLNFTMSFSKVMITFLDVKISKDMDGTLSSGLFRKPTAGNIILHASSAHPQPLIQQIPYSQYLRLRRNCSTETSFITEPSLLKIRLLNQGYSLTCLKKAFRRANGQSRSSLLFSTNVSKNQKRPTTRVITKYNNQHKLIRMSLERHPTLGPHILEFPTITFHRTKSIKRPASSK